MRRPLLLLTVAAFCALAAGARLNTGRMRTISVVLGPRQAPQLLTACDGSRVRADSFWTPDARNLRALQPRLSSRLEEMRDAGSRSELRDYSRQQLGLYRDGRRLVFINGVHDLYIRRTAELLREQGLSARQARRSTERWLRNEAVEVCDGGEAFFRAEYDVATDRVAWFAFNGRS